MGIHAESGHNHTLKLWESNFLDKTANKVGMPRGEVVTTSLEFPESVCIHWIRKRDVIIKHSSGSSALLHNNKQDLPACLAAQQPRWIPHSYSWTI